MVKRERESVVEWSGVESVCLGEFRLMFHPSVNSSQRTRFALHPLMREKSLLSLDKSLPISIPTYISFHFLHVQKKISIQSFHSNRIEQKPMLGSLLHSLYRLYSTLL
jgi:hypothetical protein